MSSVEELERAFSLYFLELERCIRANCWWAALHLLVVLPDVCAALETREGRSTGVLYRNWCARYLTNLPVSGDEFYELRCCVLHQGRLRVKRSKYSSYSLLYSDYLNEREHSLQRSKSEAVAKDDLMLDLPILAEELIAGVRRWFEALQKRAKCVEAANVACHISSLARLRVEDLAVPVVGGVRLMFLTGSLHWRGVG